MECCLSIVVIWGFYWSSIRKYGTDLGRYLYSYNSTTGTDGGYNATNGLSVRCIAEDNGLIGALNCDQAFIDGTFEEDRNSTGILVTVPYSGGNGGSHNGQTINSSGVSGLTATLTMGSFSVGSGTLSYLITGTPRRVEAQLILH
jgi:hypothetical protein